MKILRISVQNKLSKLVQLAIDQQKSFIRGIFSLLDGGKANRKPILRPNLRDIKRIKTKLCGICLIWVHNLHMRRPLDLLTGLDCLPKVTFGVVWIFATEDGRLICSELLLAVFGDEMVFDVNELTILVDPELVNSLMKTLDIYR